MIVLALVTMLQAPDPRPDATPPRPIAQWVQTRWTEREGAPSAIYDLHHGADGYLWLATGAGLYRFDGVRFVYVPISDPQLTPRTTLGQLVDGRDGSLWLIWAEGVVSHYRRGETVTYGPKQGLPPIATLAVSPEGTVVAATRKGLRRLDGGDWTDVNAEWRFPDGESQAVWFDRDGGLWAEAGDRMLYRPKDSAYFTDPGMPLRAPTPAAFAQERDGTTWMAELARSAHTIQHSANRQAMTEVLVGAWRLLVDRRGSLWIGTSGDGLRRVIDPAQIRGTRVAQFGPEAEQLTTREGLLGDVIQALAEDREGNIWIATNRGIQQFREAPFGFIPSRGTIRGRLVFATRDSSVWVTTWALGGISRIRRDRHAVVDSTARWHPEAFSGDRTGGIWTVAATSIYRLAGGRFQPLAPRVTEVLQGLNGIFIDQGDTTYVVDERAGLLRLDGDTLVPLAAIPVEPVWRSTMWKDRRGRLWINQYHRLGVYERGSLRLYRSAAGEVPRGIRTMLEDRDGNLWLGGDLGLSRCEDGRFRSLRPSQSFPGTTIFTMLEDDDGAWWLATRRGVVRLPPGEAVRALEDSSYRPRYQTFDIRDGIPGKINAELGNDLLARAADGMIWVVGDSGVARLDPRAFTPAQPPPAAVEVVRADGVEYPATGPVTLGPHVRDLEIDFTAMTLVASDRIQFRYQLAGADEAWREVGNRRRAYFTGLAPGTYEFRVVAGTADGVWGTGAARVTVRILPAWYQTLWFRVFLLLTLLGATTALALRQQRQRHQRAQDALKAKYEGTLAERARIAQDLHDTLMQGFAGVTLQLKSVELSLVDRPEATSQLERIRELARESLREARERVWEMRDSALGADGLPAALEAVARARIGKEAIELAVTVQGTPRRLPALVEDAAFRAGREAIANAVQHAAARRLDILIRFAEATLDLEIGDDGRGFTPAESDDAQRRGHFGVSGMRDRAAHAGGHCDIQPRPGGGTIVRLQLPTIPSGDRSR